MENDSSWIQSLINSKFVLVLVALIFLVLVIVVGFGLFTDKHINLFGFEFNGEKTNIAIDKPSEGNDKEEDSSNKNQITSKVIESSKIAKTENSIKDVKESNFQIGNGNTQSPINISSTNQTGGITAQNVHISSMKPQRKLNDVVKLEIINRLPVKNEIIRIYSAMGDREATNLGQQIKDFLLENGYTMVQGVDYAALDINVTQIEFYRNNSVVEIYVGSQK